ncbi:MAG: S26 family signal peptidase [Bacteroidales bacterium]|nr:S26 family signal peptidase [Candidatus Sodaliphilus aphodohippi]
MSDITKYDIDNSPKVKADDNNKKEKEYNPQTGGLKERLARVKKTRWWRFGIVAAIFVAWVAWLGNWWVLLALPLLADIYLTQFIPWGWWKGIKNKTLHTIMSWVDAIVYALVLVYFLFLFVGQNYQIPSSSLEKTLLTGDFLWVNKMVYGPRVPQTPLHFPLAQNVLPFFNCKSYIEHPQFDYHRLKGLRSVERGDIVVFNFPAGDTVTLNCPNPDYYTLVFQYGREAIRNNPQNYGEIIYRPVDRRDNYVKRCLGLPGEWISLKNGIVYINGKPLPEPQNVQYRYVVTTDGTPIRDDFFEELGISPDDRFFDGRFYQLPLTADMVKQLKAQTWVTNVERVTDEMMADNTDIMLSYPVGYDYGWTHNNYGPLWIPKKGVTMHLTLDNLPKYERCIKNYEGNSLEVKDGKIYINGKETDRYTFKMDYYWMMGGNRDNSLDSRYWGFVPEDHVVGTPMIVLISFDKDKRLLDGGIRWNRIFKMPTPDKK